MSKKTCWRKKRSKKTCCRKKKELEDLIEKEEGARRAVVE